MKEKEFKKYPKYKPSDIEWIGEIPEEWEFKKTKYCFNYTTGFTPPTGQSEYYNGDHIWITISDMNQKYLSDSSTKLSDKAIEKYKPDVTPKGSLLFSFKLSVGKVAFAGTDVYTNEAIISIIPNENVNLDYYFYILPDQLLRNANENIYGAKLLNQELIKNASIIFPPPAEQTAIANYLADKTAKIDTLIEKKKKLIELLKEERTAVINQAVTKGINPNVKLKPSGIEWLGEIPEHWEVKKLKYVAKVQSSNVDKKTIEGEVPILLCNYVDVYKNEFIDDSFNFMEATATAKEIGKFILHEGDVLITKDSETPDDIANPAYVKQDFNNVICGYHLAQIKPNKSQLLGEFLFRLFQSKKFNSHFEVSANGVTRFGLPLDSITDVKVSFPKLDEQIQIVQYIETETKRIDGTISKIEKEIELLAEYRTALISEVVTGKIDVRNMV